MILKCSDKVDGVVYFQPGEVNETVSEINLHRHNKNVGTFTSLKQGIHIFYEQYKKCYCSPDSNDSLFVWKHCSHF